MNEAQLRAFIRIRNRSEFASNLQFEFDATEAGFDVRDLGKGDWHEMPDGDKAFRWETPFGTLQELRGKLALFDAAGKQIYPGLIVTGFRPPFDTFEPDEAPE